MTDHMAIGCIKFARPYMRVNLGCKKEEQSNQYLLSCCVKGQNPALWKHAG